MRCLFYAVGKWVKEGGYLKIRASHYSQLLPHFLHESKDGKVSQFVPDSPKIRWLCPLWFKGHIKYGDNGKDK